VVLFPEDEDGIPGHQQRGLAGWLSTRVYYQGLQNTDILFFYRRRRTGTARQAVVQDLVSGASARVTSTLGNGTVLLYFLGKRCSSKALSSCTIYIYFFFNTKAEGYLC
jgi:hypothetical protein